MSEIAVLSAKFQSYERNLNFIGENPKLRAKSLFYRRNSKVMSEIAVLSANSQVMSEIAVLSAKF
ncbi:hypothetical protein LG298_15955 [Cytobacillus firmus]|uniref:hypothetical protein n=1 Tax=Cytobacillus firmus TaxID=1399 RepID=UPI00384FCCC4